MGRLAASCRRAGQAAKAGRAGQRGWLGREGGEISCCSARPLCMFHPAGCVCACHPASQQQARHPPPGGWRGCPGSLCRHGMASPCPSTRAHLPRDACSRQAGSWRGGKQAAVKELAVEAPGSGPAGAAAAVCCTTAAAASLRPCPRCTGWPHCRTAGCKTAWVEQRAARPSCQSHLHCWNRAPAPVRCAARGSETGDARRSAPRARARDIAVGLPASVCGRTLGCLRNPRV